MKQISITYLEKSSQVAIMKTKLNTNLFEDRFDLLFLKCKSFKLSSFLWFYGSAMDSYWTVALKNDIFFQTILKIFYYQLGHKQPIH